MCLYLSVLQNSRAELTLKMIIGIRYKHFLIIIQDQLQSHNYFSTKWWNISPEIHLTMTFDIRISWLNSFIHHLTSGLRTLVFRESFNHLYIWYRTIIIQRSLSDWFGKMAKSIWQTFNMNYSNEINFFKRLLFCSFHEIMKYCEREE